VIIGGGIGEGVVLLRLKQSNGGAVKWTGGEKVRRGILSGARERQAMQAAGYRLLCSALPARARPRSRCASPSDAAAAAETTSQAVDAARAAPAVDGDLSSAACTALHCTAPRPAPCPPARRPTPSPLRVGASSSAHAAVLGSREQASAGRNNKAEKPHQGRPYHLFHATLSLAVT
jgi:hypothetical protein